MQVRIDYSLTLFGLGRSYAMPSLDGEERMPGWGWCKTKMNEAGTAVELHCIEPGKGPICGTVFLENASSGAQRKTHRAPPANRNIAPLETSQRPTTSRASAATFPLSRRFRFGQVSRWMGRNFRGRVS